jgi:hypothetical protein
MLRASLWDPPATRVKFLVASLPALCFNVHCHGMEPMVMCPRHGGRASEGKEMQNLKTRPPVPFDLSQLPEGFRKAVEREFFPKTYGYVPIALAWAIGNAWANSTAKQRQAAELGVNGVLKAALANFGEWSDPAMTRQVIASHIVGIIGALCLDLNMDFVDLDDLDGAEVLRAVREAGGVRVNVFLDDLVDSVIDNHGMLPFPDAATVWQAVDAYCDLCWPYLAALGWRRYGEAGRGAVVMLWEDLSGEVGRIVAGEAPRLTVDYMLTFDEGSEIAGIVAGYDPEQSIVVLVVEERWEGGGVPYDASRPHAGGTPAAFHGRFLPLVVTRSPAPGAMAKRVSN